MDLVGHDWGAVLVLRAACLAPERVRSWVAGGAPLDAEYAWHRAAQLWQTPEVGEKVMAQTTPTGARLVTFPGCSHWWSLGRPAEVAAEIRAHWSGLR